MIHVGRWRKKDVQIDLKFRFPVASVVILDLNQDKKRLNIHHFFLNHYFLLKKKTIIIDLDGVICS